jgi:NADH dehydrogenase/NADH:ubiquinone oxidoreductase subunit G
MRRSTVSQNAAAAMLAVTLALGGCSAASVIDSLPTEVGGLPANAPKRPDNPANYPAVHDVRARPDKPLNLEQQFELEDELSKARTRQNNLQNKDAISRAQAEVEKAGAARARAIEAAKAGSRAGAQPAAKTPAEKPPATAETR